MYCIHKITLNPTVDFAAEELKKYLRMMMPRCGEVAIDYDAKVEKDFRLGLMQATSYLGFKIRNEGILYLLHNRATGLLPEKTAMDHVLCQKVLPRIQGGTKAVGSMLADFLAYCRENGYEETARKAEKMRLSCEENGYCSCWETE